MQLKEYLINKTLPRDPTTYERVLHHVDDFITDQNHTFMEVQAWDVALYRARISWRFHGDFTPSISHLSYMNPGLSCQDKDDSTPMYYTRLIRMLFMS